MRGAQDGTDLVGVLGGQSEGAGAASQVQSTQTVLSDETVFSATLETSVVPQVGTQGSFDRASTEGYCVDTTLTGVRLASASNPAQPSFSYFGLGTRGGVQLQGPRQNVVFASQDLTGWTNYGTVTSKTANSQAAPDWTTTATRLVLGAGSSGLYRLFTPSYAAASAKMVISFWVKASTGTPTIRYGAECNNDTAYSSLAITTNWQRVVLYRTFGAGATGNVDVYIGSSTAGITIDVWGYQVEKVTDATYGSGTQGATALIQTTAAAAATVADVLQFPASDIGSAMVAGTIMVFVNPSYSSSFSNTSAEKYVLSMNGDAISIRLCHGAIKATYGGVTVTGATTWSANGWMGLAFTWTNSSGTALALYKNGSLIGSSSSAASTPTATGFYVGSKSGASTENYLDGIAALLKWKRVAMSAANVLTEFEADKLAYGFQPVDPGSITMSTTSFPEATANDGSVTQTATMTVTLDRWISSSGVMTQDTHYTVTGVPAGLTLVVTRTSNTTATVSFTGSAVAHAESDSTTAIALTILPAAMFSNLSPSGASQTLSIAFRSGTPTVSYSTTLLTESGANDGSVTETVVCTMTGDTLVNGPYSSGTHYTLGGTSVPSGLTLVVTRTSASIATISFTGNAAAHAFANSVTGLTLTWKTNIFTGGAIPTDGTQALTYAINFADPNPAAGHINLRGTDYTINAHPRIWISAARKTALQARSTTSNSVWNALLFRCNQTISSASTSYAAADLNNYAAAYFGDPTLTVYRDAAITIMGNIAALSDATSWSNDFISESFAFYARAYDWLYDDMTAGQRSAYRNWFYNIGIPYAQTHPSNHHAPTQYYGPISNLTVTKWMGETMLCLAMMDDDSNFTTLAQWNYDYMIDTLVPIYDAAYAGGHTFSGSHYGHARLMKWWVYVMDALETSLVGMTGFRQFAKDYLAFWLHNVLPNKTHKFGEWEPGGVSIAAGQGRETENLPVIINKYPTEDNSKYAQYWIINDHFPNITMHGDYVGRWHTWFDPSNTAVDYSALPLSYDASGVGVAFSRDAWNSATAFWMHLSSSEAWGDHQTNTPGSIKCFRNGEYGVIEWAKRYVAGNPQGSSSDPTYCSTVYWGNGVAIYDQWGHTVVSGGYWRRNQSNIVSTIKRSEYTTSCCMLANLDSTVSTYSFPGAYFRRSVAHFRPGGQNYVAVVDSVGSTGAVQKKVQVYVSGAPTIASNVATVSLTNNKLFVACVAPAVTMTQEAITDVTNDTEIAQTSTDTPTRLVIDEGSASAAQVFVHVISMAASGATMPTCESAADATGQLQGVYIQDPTAAKVFLASKNTATVSATFSVTLSDALAVEWVVSGLVAGDKYNYGSSTNTRTFTKNAGGSITVDASGVLQYQESV